MNKYIKAFTVGCITRRVRKLHNRHSTNDRPTRNALRERLAFIGYDMRTRLKMNYAEIGDVIGYSSSYTSQIVREYELALQRGA